MWWPRQTNGLAARGASAVGDPVREPRGPPSLHGADLLRPHRPWGVRAPPVLGRPRVSVSLSPLPEKSLTVNVEAGEGLTPGSRDQALRLRTAASCSGCRAEAPDSLGTRLTVLCQTVLFFFFFNLFHLSIVDLTYRVNFCRTAK